MPRPTLLRAIARHLPRRWARAALALAGLVAVAATVPAGAAAAEDAMAFKLMTIRGKGGCPRDCAEVITAEGEITNETADKFVAFLSEHLQDHDLRPVVLLESPGGTVVGAMQLGAVFRSIGAAVVVASARQIADTQEVAVVPGACMSACVYAFIGGIRRVVPPISRLGIHRMVITEDVPDANGITQHTQIFGTRDIVASLSAYAKAMGVDPRMIGYAETIAPEQLHIVTAREIARWKLGRPHL